MENPNGMTEDNQPLVEATAAGGPDALTQLGDMLKASLKPIQAEAKEEEAPEEPEEQQEPALPDVEPEPESDPEPQAGLPKGVQKRLDRLTAQKKERDERIEALEAKIEDLSTKLAAPAVDNKTPTTMPGMIASAQTEQDLDRLEDQAIEAQRWARRALTQYRRNPETVEQEIQAKIGQTPDDVETFLEDMLLNAEESREVIIPKRRKQIAETSKQFQEAAKRYTWLADEKSPLRAHVEGMLNQHPALREIPGIYGLMAQSLIGMAWENGQLGPKQSAPAPGAKPTPQPGRPARQGASVSDVERKLAAAKKKAENGSIDGATQFISAMLQPKG